MNTLNIECQKIQDWFANNNLPIDVFKEHPVGQPDNPHRAYISSRLLGGLLICSLDGLWAPCWPEKSNYPIKGRWFSCGQKRMPWKLAILATINPKKYLKGIDDLSMRVAIERAEKLRDPLRIAALTAKLENIK